MVSITYIIELILDLWNCGSTIACGLFDLYRIETDSVPGFHPQDSFDVSPMSQNMQLNLVELYPLTNMLWCLSDFIW